MVQMPSIFAHFLFSIPSKDYQKFYSFYGYLNHFLLGGFINSTNTLFLSLYYILFITTRANRQSIKHIKNTQKSSYFFHLQHTLCIFYKTEAPFLLAKEHKAYFLIQLKVSIHICSK